MSIDSLKSLITNVPDWLRRLDDLNEQIEQRQLDLAKFDEQNSSSARSMRNRGSTESLKPKDDGVAHPDAQETPQVCPLVTVAPQSDAQHAQPGIQPATPQPSNGTQDETTPAASPQAEAAPTTPSTNIQRQEVIAAAQSRARATINKRQKTESMVSAQAGVSTYRSRNMVIVYYDSYVQSFFEELVKFVSASRNLMRKAKMAAKVAQIKRLAELEKPDDTDGSGEDELKPGDCVIAADPRLSARPNGIDRAAPLYPGAQQMGLMPRHPPPGMYQRSSRLVATPTFGGGLGVFSQKGDIYDDLDKGLEFVQGMCERAAHQFLRDGDCNDEIEKIKTRLDQTRELAAKEMDRTVDENPRLLQESETPKNRSYRPTSMRRDTGASSPAIKKDPTRNISGVLELDDEGIEDIDDLQPDVKAPTLMTGPTP